MCRGGWDKALLGRFDKQGVACGEFVNRFADKRDQCNGGDASRRAAKFPKPGDSEPKQGRINSRQSAIGFELWLIQGNLQRNDDSGDEQAEQVSLRDESDCSEGKRGKDRQIPRSLPVTGPDSDGPRRPSYQPGPAEDRM